MSSGPIDEIAVTADGTRLLTTHNRHGALSVIDTTAGVVLSTVPGLPEASAVACGETARASLRTASAAYDAVATIDLRAKAVVGRQPMALNVTDLAVSRDGRRVYASRTGAARADVAVLDTTTGQLDVIGIASTPGRTADGVRLSPDGRRLYVSVRGCGSAQLAVIDTRERRIISSLEIGAPIRDVALSPSGRTAYVVSCSPDFGAVLDVVDTRVNVIASTAKIDGVGDFVTQLALSRDGNRTYLVSELGVTVLSTRTLDVVGSVPTTNQPSCVVENPHGSQLYVADYSGALTAFAITAPSASAEDSEIIARHDWAVQDVVEPEPALLVARR